MGLRFLIAIIAMIILKVLKLIEVKLSFKDIIAILPIAIFQPLLYFIGETYGVYYTSASMAGIFMALIPVLTAGISFFMLKEKLSFIQLLFVVLSLSGVVLISIMTLTDAPSSLAIGVLFLLLAVVAGSFYTVLTRKATKTYSPISITFVMMAFGAIVFNIAGYTDSLINDYSYLKPFLELRFLGAIMFLGVLSSVGAFFLMVYTGSKVSASQNALFVNLTTVVAILSGVIFLKEQIFIYQIIGSVMIILGVWGANFFSEHKISRRNN